MALGLMQLHRLKAGPGCTHTFFMSVLTVNDINVYFKFLDLCFER